MNNAMPLIFLLHSPQELNTDVSLQITSRNMELKILLIGLFLL
jgi:hypothetical protein